MKSNEMERKPCWFAVIEMDREDFCVWVLDFFRFDREGGSQTSSFCCVEDERDVLYIRRNWLSWEGTTRCLEKSVVGVSRLRVLFKKQDSNFTACA